MLETTAARAAGLDATLALRLARSIERDPSKLDTYFDLVREIRAFPEAREIIDRVFKARKVAHRYQRARLLMHSSAVAFA
jgi:hypothetical protein